MIAAVAVWTLLLGVLGFAPLPELPLNDKALHFFGMGFAAFLIYFIFEVPE
jgi:mannose/fructose/N-acetylgalactosamine-specific phosphotransferase system component IIC